jgi:anti-sigma-K factor RskA
MTHQDYKEMLPLYSLEVVEEAEGRALEQHLATCADCRGEVGQWRDTTSMLAYAASPASPAPELRSRIIEALRSSKRKPVARAASGSGGVVRERSTPGMKSAARDSKAVEFAPRSWKSEHKLLAIAASLALVALIASLFVIWSRNRSLQAEVTRLSSGLDQAQGKLSRLEQDSELINAPTLTVATLKGTSMARKAQGKLMYDQKTGRAIFTASNLPPAPAGMAYQLWYLAGKHPTPGAVFNIDASGNASMRDQLPPEARTVTAFAVTLEPAKGASAPTGKMYLVTPPS